MLKGKTITLIIILSVVGGLLLGGLAVYLWLTFMTKEPAEKTNTEQPTANNIENIPSNTYTRPSTTTEPDKAVLSYSNTGYSTNFVYPEEWVGVNEDPLSAEENPIFGFAETDLQFASVEDGIPNIRITTMDNIENASPDGDMNALSNLRSMYSSSNVSTITDGMIVMPMNAGAYYFTAPQYMESSNKSFRGYYYYAVMGNGLAPEGPTVTLPTFFAELTNGDTIIQISAQTDQTTPAGAVECSSPQTLPSVNCILPTQLSTSISENILELIDSLE